MRGGVFGAPPAIEYIKSSQLGVANGAASLDGNGKLPTEQLPDHEHVASKVKFEDGETFQEKYDAGELTGSAGASAYDLAKAAGYTGTLEEFMALLAAVHAHASRHAADGADPITPADIGAVNKAGDTMGPLTVYGSWPNIRSQNSDDDRISDFYTSAMGASIIARTLTDGANTNRMLIVCPQDSQELPNALQLADVNAGVWTFYNILHTGNSNRSTLVSAETTPTENNAINWTYE